MSVARRRFKKLLNRAQAIQKIQHNARIYLQLRDWPWWSLYVKVRPLLAATKTDSALVKKQAELAMAKERAERDQEEKRRLEELKVTLLAEKTQVERDLVSERELARDKDLMLERSKGREAELLEKIAELEDDLTTLDGEREEAVLAKLQNEMEQLVTQAGLLEKQSAAWRQREAGLLSESKDRATAHSKLENERMEMVRLVDNLKRELGQKEEAMKRAKERGDMNAAELEKRLQLEKGKS
jgi:myosin protein heavy chain